MPLSRKPKIGLCSKANNNVLATYTTSIACQHKFRTTIINQDLLYGGICTGLQKKMKSHDHTLSAY